MWLVFNPHFDPLRAWRRAKAEAIRIIALELPALDAMSPKFHERFDLRVNLDEARKRFVNRAYNEIWTRIFLRLTERDQNSYQRQVLTAIGERVDFRTALTTQIGEGFTRNLQAIEALYEAMHEVLGRGQLLSIAVQSILGQAEVDLGVEWRDGRFWRTGAANLDAGLVNDPLRWLRQADMHNVLTPYEKGLGHLLVATQRPEVLADVITDMYEALEALAKNVTGRAGSDLSGNRELFIAKVKASAAYKKLLADYISYANEFRHAAELGTSKPTTSLPEVESFVYLTGVFIRLAISAGAAEGSAGAVS